MTTRRAYAMRARKLLLKACETCGGNTRLSVHHRDRDWRNNAPENIQTLCTPCHMKLHHEAGDIVPRKQRRPCETCGKQALRNLCEACRSRKRRQQQRAAS